MKKEITCNVISDLLPLYVDDVLSSDSRELVSEHLNNCESCRESLEKMDKTLVITNDSDTERIEKMKKRMSTKKLLTISIVCVAAAAALFGGGIILGEEIGSRSGDELSKIKQFIVISVSVMLSVLVLVCWSLYFYRFNKASQDKNPEKTNRVTAIVLFALFAVYGLFGLGFKLLFYGNAADSSNVAVRTEFQYSERNYLSQEWVIHFNLTNGKPINPITECIYSTDSDGVRFCSGMNIYIREVPVKGMMESGIYTSGYGCATPLENDYLPNDTNFMINVIYKDKKVVYDMRKEGLYEKQSSVKYAPESPDSPTSALSVRTAENIKGTG